MLPNPRQVVEVKRQCNENLKQFISKWYAIEGEILDSTIANKWDLGADAKSWPKSMHLGPENSPIINLQVGEKNMVQFYIMIMEELQGKLLIFIQQLDKAKIVKKV